MIQGQVLKKHSDFYYVYAQNQLFECKLKTILKKQKQNVVVGDFVLLEQIISESKQAFISKIIERKNFLLRPQVANIDLVVIITSLISPEFNQEQLDRYIALCEYYKLKPVILFNKIDLVKDISLYSEIFNLYKNLGYEIFLLSAKNKLGFENMKSLFKDKITVLCGSSGVGKSTFINSFSCDLNLKTKEISKKTQKGTHTTRHCEIHKVYIDNLNKKDQAFIVDTPGFSQLKFDFLLPSQLDSLFIEIKKFKDFCKFKDCTHTKEIDCNVIKNLDKINKVRYNNYLKFLEESRNYKKYLLYNGNKVETTVKNTQDKIYTKISSKKRVYSRKKQNQALNDME